METSNIKSLNSTSSNVLEFIELECKKLKVEYVFSLDSHVKCGDIICNGYFIDSPVPTLAVGMGKPEHLWLTTLIHEYNHMQQWKEQSKEWLESTISENIEAMDLIDLWIQGTISLDESQKDKIFSRSIAVEKDCEERTVKFIIENGLTNLINPIEYAQKANAYILFYHMVKKTRKWYIPGKEPYNNPQIYTKMPSHFNLDYSALTPELETILEEAYL